MSDERERESCPRTYPWEHPWPGPGSGSIVASWGQDCHDTEVSSSRCLSLSQKILFQGNQKCEPFRVIFKSLYILFDDCHLLASVPSLKICWYLFKYISKSFYLVSVQNGWRFMVESHRLLYADSGPGPSLSPRPAWAGAASTIWRLGAVRAGPVSSEAGCNETYTRLTHPTLGKTMTPSTETTIYLIALHRSSINIIVQKIL